MSSRITSVLILSIFIVFSVHAQQKKAPPPGVLVAVASQKQLTKSTQLLGKTLAVNDVSIRARVSGYLLDKNFKEGSEVLKDSLLFRLDPKIYQSIVNADKAGVSEAKAQLARTSADYARYLELSEKNYVSRQDLDLSKANKLQAISALEAANAKLARSEIDLADTQLRAPIHGRVGRASVSAGNLIDSSSGELVRLVELDPIYVNFNIAEAQLLTLQDRERERKNTGGTNEYYNIQIILPDGQLHPQFGTIDFVDNAVNPLTGTILIRARFGNPQKNLVPGLNVLVEISSEEKKSELTIPQVSVQEDQTGYFVMLVNKSNTVEKRQLSLGRKAGIDWVVNDGLTPGERVIVSGVQKVRPGIIVNPEPAPAMTPEN